MVNVLCIQTMHQSINKKLQELKKQHRFTTRVTSSTPEFPNSIHSTPSPLNLAISPIGPVVLHQQPLLTC